MAMKRPDQDTVPTPRTGADLHGWAAKARYVGSGEHKAGRWWGGLSQVPRDRGGKPKRPGKATTTICPLTQAADRDRATKWIATALKDSQFLFGLGDKDYPRYVWFRADDQWWLGRCINGIAGTYKGWPIDDDEWRKISSRVG